MVSVENLANSAAKHGCKLVFFSSDQIYNGNLESGLLTEEMPVAPESHYGRHKLLAEQRALNICPDSVALRATWMYDDQRPGMKTHNNFVLNFRNAAENHLNTYETAREYAGMLGWKADEMIIADTDRFPEHVRNISISMKKAHEASGAKDAKSPANVANLLYFCLLFYQKEHYL